MTQEKLTTKLLENILQQRIKELYHEQLKHEPKDVSVYYFEQTVVVIVDGIMTKTEIFLGEHSQNRLAQQVSYALNEVIEYKLKQIIEEVMKVTVIDLLYKAKSETDRMGAIAMFAVYPN